MAEIIVVRFSCRIAVPVQSIPHYAMSIPWMILATLRGFFTSRRRG